MIFNKHKTMTITIGRPMLYIFSRDGDLIQYDNDEDEKGGEEEDDEDV